MRKKTTSATTEQQIRQMDTDGNKKIIRVDRIDDKQITFPLMLTTETGNK